MTIDEFAVNMVRIKTESVLNIVESSIDLLYVCNLICIYLGRGTLYSLYDSLIKDNWGRQ
jgi:hypothetical protein